jgi:hypothetical protein
VSEDEEELFDDEEDALEALAPWFKRHKRSAWKPKTAIGDGSSTASKFAGTPWLGASESWPNCGSCGSPMRLFLQLNLDVLPKRVAGRFGKGLLQLFICIREQCLSDSYGNPFSESQLLRLVQPKRRGSKAVIPSFDDLHSGQFPPKKITGWKRVDDYPSVPDFAELGVLFPQESLRQVGNFAFGNLQCPELGISSEVSAEGYSDLGDRCISGEKLAGWSDWVQVNAYYPNCLRCERRMDTIVFQIGSNDNIPFMFADGGQGPITQCPVHKDVLGFQWDSG